MGFSSFSDMSTELGEITDVCVEIGKGCNFSCDNCRGDSGSVSTQTKFIADVTTRDLDLIFEQYNINKVRVGGLYSEPTKFRDSALAGLMRHVRRVKPDCERVVISNGTTLLQHDLQDLSRYVVDVLGFEHLDNTSRLYVSMDDPHYEAFVRMMAREGTNETEALMLYRDIANRVNKLASLAGYVGYAVSVNTMISLDTDMEEAAKSAREKWGVDVRVPFNFPRISVYAPWQEELLSRYSPGVIVDKREGQASSAEKSNPSAFVRRTRGGLMLYKTIEDMGYKRNGNRLD